MIKVQRALISVSDKTGIIELAKGLNELKVEILSTGGTAKLLRDSGIAVKDVSEHTGFPEMLDGRVKTLHPMIHGGLLAVRDNPEHMEQLKKHGIKLIDMVVVNLYPFEKTVAKKNIELAEAIENIDIGGPSMLRSAAKNYRSVAVICNPARYKEVLSELKKNNGMLSDTLLRDLAVEVFQRTSQYDGAIYNFLNSRLKTASSITEVLPKELNLNFIKVQDLRYGENPHQKAAFYEDPKASYGLPKAKQLHGKELSFNNILDLNAALNIAREFKNPAAVVIKHTNPCGVAEAKTLVEAFKDAWDGDPISAFGSIIGLNRPVDEKAAQAISQAGFVECIIAPGYSAEALNILKEKKNVRLIELDIEQTGKEIELRKVDGGLLVQEKDDKDFDIKDLKVVTKTKPTKKQLQSLIFAWKVAKHVKSNAIVLAKGTMAVGVGAGQMSRVDSTVISVMKSRGRAKGSVLASDAFFPKEDAIKAIAKAKIKAIIQPGGSIADEEIIKEADKAKIAMVFCGMRHFMH
ncbi:MAG: bifunctional phosphoribosylaminoimidazolecarboxamide formyltransferase/IMP cyclohydrolase [Candidatus Omnitrophica bacterium]|nr:bifunctional phosphoribosylaminoimidazolecarboxamide formyltransferase/IMP cyclohydrolase [Candidatus Omnitrophota bacterium]